jgi:hypothetical protein
MKPYTIEWWEVILDKQKAVYKKLYRRSQQVRNVNHIYIYSAKETLKQSDIVIWVQNRIIKKYRGKP